MKTSDILLLFCLATIGGSSFLFMRVSTPELGPVLIILLRVLFGALFLLPFALQKNCLPSIKNHYTAITFVGLFSSAIPFVLFAYATLSLSAGFTAVLNSGTPFFTALLGYFLLKEKLDNWRAVGMCVALVGIVVLVWDKLGNDFGNSGLPTIAGLLAAASYATAAILSKKYLQGISPLAVSTGSLIASTLLLTPSLIWVWPAAMPSATAWTSVVVLGIACTGINFILFFKLLIDLGPVTASSVTFLVPVFGIIFGIVFLNETVTLTMILGCGIIFTGTALSTGLLKNK